MAFIILFLILVFFPDVYIGWSFLRGTSILWKIVFALPSVLLLATLVAGALGHYQNWLMNLFFGLLVCIALPKLLFTVVSLIGRLVAVASPGSYPVINIVGVAVAVIGCCASAYGLAYGWKHVVTKHIEVSSGKLPAAFDGYTIVQLSDFHIGTYENAPNTVREIVAKVNALQPDLIVFTGDLVNVSPQELNPFMDALKQLRAKDGVLSILGNHDYCSYQHYDTADGALRNLEELKRREKTIGWDLLLNEHRVIQRGSDSIVIVGVENDGKPPFPSRADLSKALKGTDDDCFKVLLSHDPTHWRRNILPETNAVLTLSGHTHAMQLKLGSFSPAALTYDEWGGLYSEADRYLHVSTGVGSNVGFRFGAWPEIDVIRLKTK